MLIITLGLAVSAAEAPAGVCGCWSFSPPLAEDDDASASDAVAFAMSTCCNFLSVFFKESTGDCRFSCHLYACIKLSINLYVNAVIIYQS